MVLVTPIMAMTGIMAVRVATACFDRQKTSVDGVRDSDCKRVEQQDEAGRRH